MVSNELARPLVTTAISSSIFGKSFTTWPPSLASWQLAHLAWKICAPCCRPAIEVDVALDDVDLVWLPPPPPQATNSKPTAATSLMALAVHRHMRISLCSASFRQEN